MRTLLAIHSGRRICSLNEFDKIINDLIRPLQEVQKIWFCKPMKAKFEIRRLSEAAKVEVKRILRESLRNRDAIHVSSLLVP